MSPEEIRQLLQQPESETLDFKLGPYPFHDAPDSDKCKLLRDILSFANARRRDPARILIGVDEVGPTVVGIPDDDRMDDPTLQQFVNSKLNRRIRLLYSHVKLGEKRVAVIEIDPVAQRPIHVTRAFGGLQPEAVPMRRGSTNSLALPDEVVEMGRGEQPRPKLEVLFVEPEHGEVMGASNYATAGQLLLPRPGTLERLDMDTKLQLEGQYVNKMLNGGRRPTKERFDKAAAKCRTFPLRFAVSNSGEASAKAVKVELFIPGYEDFCALQIEEMDRVGTLGPPSPAETMTIEPHFEGALVQAHIARVRPGETLPLRGVVRAEATRAGVVSIRARVLSDDLRVPVESILMLEVAIEQRVFRLKP